MFGLLKTVEAFEAEEWILHHEMFMSLWNPEYMWFVKKMPPKDYVSEHLVPSRWCCFERLWNLGEVEPYRRKLAVH